MPQLRRSARLASSKNVVVSEEDTPKENAKKRTILGKEKAVKKKPSKRIPPKQKTTLEKELPFLPRTIELSSKFKDKVVIGVDEAGRGPLAGPVVAAAVILPTDFPGITDSKKIRESDRLKLYHLIIKSQDVRWAAAIIDAKKIDEINILQATMEAMTQAVEKLIVPDTNPKFSASADIKGCYTVQNFFSPASNLEYHALIDGNRVPPNLPCDSDFIIKGDSKEYCIAAASIIAKVTRDLLMEQYDAMYPEYNFKKHKGYPTAAHMASVWKIGACEIHRRTFRPLKDMDLMEKETEAEK